MAGVGEGGWGGGNAAAGSTALTSQTQVWALPGSNRQEGKGLCAVRGGSCAADPS